MRAAFYVLVLLSPFLAATRAEDLPANRWRKLEPAGDLGRRNDVPLVFAPSLGRFMVLGGRASWGEDRKAPRPYDVLCLDAAREQWQNWLPPGKEWGPEFGPVTAPPWENELWGLRDTEGNVRPNWMVYGTFSLGRAYAWDSDRKQFLFYAGGSTFAFDPTSRAWTDLAPPTHPQGVLGGTLLWSSLAYHADRKQTLLFGGGNVQSPRGDPGTWLYDAEANAWRSLDADPQPSQRANSMLAYDPVAQETVLFGGDRLDALLNDTWAFDGERWQRLRPTASPPPRAGHALLWLPKAQKLLLLGGYGFQSGTGYGGDFYRTLPLEAWVLDRSRNTWRKAARFEGPVPEQPACGFLSAAVGADDTLCLVDERRATWLCRLDLGTLPADDEKGVAGDQVERRTGPYDPDWYRTDVPPANPRQVATELARLPANAWSKRPTPKLPRPNMDWGSAVFDVARDQILRFSGGHSAYSGTAPQVYDVSTDRYSIPFAPEMPLEYCRSNDQVQGEWSFAGRPWMTGHTYKATGYDPLLKELVFAGHDYTYFFSSEGGEWTRSPERCPFVPGVHMVTLCPTPEGVVAWADRRRGDGSALWRMDAASRTWRELPLEGKLPAAGPDRHGLAYDKKRQRLLLFSSVDTRAGDVLAYDLTSGAARWLDVPVRVPAVMPRETVYLPEQDAVLVAAHLVRDGETCWPLFDCARQAWLGIKLGGDDPLGEHDFANSVGLMYDPKRNLVWLVDHDSRIHVLRIDTEAPGAVVPLE